MLLYLAGGVAAALLLLAVIAAKRQRALGGEIRSLREQLQDISARLASAEKSADEAATRADAAGSVLLDKGIANEEDLEAARRRSDLPVEPQLVRGSRTLH